MTDRGLTWDEAMEFDRMSYIASLREIEDNKNRKRRLHHKSRTNQMSERDPRVDPMPGDVLTYTTTLKRVKCVRRVIKVSARKVLYKLDERFTIYDWKNDWKRWAAGATVVRQAQDKG